MIDRVALALTAAIWILPACAQTTSGSIEGQTVNLKTGAPLRDATVTLSGPYAKGVLDPDEPPLSPQVRVSSGDQGRFAFHNLAAGNYSISAGRAGFRSGGYSETRVARELLPVGEGQQVKDVVIKLAPLGVIACRVVDEAGIPPNSRTGCGSRSGGTATKWLSLPTSIPPAFAWRILSPGSSEANRRPKSLRCLRFSEPVVSRSKVDFLRLAMSYSCCLKLTQARLGWPRNYRLSSGVGPGLFQGWLATNQCIAAAEVMLKDGHKGAKQMSTIACRLGL